MSHYKGKKHAQKVHDYIQTHGKEDERQEHGKENKTDCASFQMDGSGAVDRNTYCNLCNMFFTSPVNALSHYLGKIHSKKVKQFSGAQVHTPEQSMQPVSVQQSPAEQSLPSPSTRSKVNDPNKYCLLCCAPFGNPLVAQQHYGGKKHRRSEARKKILEEPGDKAVPVESGACAVGAGYYMCSVCNITLTSIGMYQSHLQGNKHRIKETSLVNLMKKPKKTGHSFQDELTDCVKVQKAGGQELRRCLGKPEEKEFQNENVEGGGDLSEVVSSDFKSEQGQHPSLFSETQLPTNTREKRSPNGPSACEYTLEKTPNYRHSIQVFCKEEQEDQAFEVATIRDKSFSLLAAESKDCHKVMCTENSTSSSKIKQKFQIKDVEEKKYISKELKCEKEVTKQKRKKPSEGADFGEENETQKRIKVEVDLANEKKSAAYKDDRLEENPAERESKKDQKKPQEDVKREEELLWDELGH